MQIIKNKISFGALTGLICLLLLTLVSLFKHYTAPPQNDVLKSIPAKRATIADTAFGKDIDPPSALGIAIAKGASLGDLPESLAGTDVDGELSMDAQGNLVINLGLRGVFDYFLATIGEEDLPEIRARIAYYLKQHLSPAATKQAWEVLNAYMDYKLELDNKEQHDGSYAGMRDSLAMQRALRISILGPSLATAFYQAEDEYSEFAMHQAEIAADPSLTAQEKQQLADSLLEGISQTNRHLIQPDKQPLQVERNIEQWREQGMTDTQIFEYREQQLGADAAGRLAALDQQRDRWQKRYTDYRQQMADIRNSGLSGTDQSAAIEQLRRQRFEPSELKRVSVLDRMAGEHLQ